MLLRPHKEHTLTCILVGCTLNCHCNICTHMGPDLLKQKQRRDCSRGPHVLQRCTGGVPAKFRYVLKLQIVCMWLQPATAPGDTCTAGSKCSTALQKPKVLCCLACGMLPGPLMGHTLACMWKVVWRYFYLSLQYMHLHWAHLLKQIQPVD